MEYKGRITNDDDYATKKYVDDHSGGGEPELYLKDASISSDGNRLTLTKKDDSTVVFNPKTASTNVPKGFVIYSRRLLLNFYDSDMDVDYNYDYVEIPGKVNHVLIQGELGNYIPTDLDYGRNRMNASTKNRYWCDFYSDFENKTEYFEVTAQAYSNTHSDSYLHEEKVKQYQSMDYSSVATDMYPIAYISGDRITYATDEEGSVNSFGIWPFYYNQDDYVFPEDDDHELNIIIPKIEYIKNRDITKLYIGGEHRGPSTAFFAAIELRMRLKIFYF